MLLGKTVLLISTLAFIGYGIPSLFSPAIPADFAGLIMTSGDAFTEIGAMYGGLQTGLGIFCAIAFLKPQFYRSGLLFLVLAIGTLALGRLFALLSAPDPVTNYSYGALGYEFVTALLALLALLRAK